MPRLHPLAIGYETPITLVAHFGVVYKEKFGETCRTMRIFTTHKWFENDCCESVLHDVNSKWLVGGATSDLYDSVYECKE